MGSRATGRGKLTEEAYRRLREGIMRGDFPTGSVLAETEVARQLGSSRTPVRHALGLLLQEGLLEVGSRRQVIVRGFTPEHRAEILLLREALESVAVRRACEVMTLEDIDYLRLLLIRQRRAAREGQNEDFVDLDEEFHLKISEGARLPLLYGFLSQLRGFVRVARLGSPRSPEVLAKVVDEHEQLVDALEQRNVDEALSVLVAHLHRWDYATDRRKPARAAR
jgi:GntR family transcriptional regulator, rspAB operon transcriptional repressor